MNAPDCAWVTDALDEWIAGGLDPETARAVEAHVEACPSCRLDAEAARAVALALPGLPRAIPPARDLWSGVARRIADPPRHRLRGALIAATVALVGTVGLWAALRRVPTPAMDVVASSPVEEAADELAVERLGDPSLPAPVRSALARDLDIIDTAIRDAKAQLQASHDDPVAKALVESAIRKKLRLLRRLGDYTS